MLRIVLDFKMKSSKGEIVFPRPSRRVLRDKDASRVHVQYASKRTWIEYLHGAFECQKSMIYAHRLLVVRLAVPQKLYVRFLMHMLAAMLNVGGRPKGGPAPHKHGIEFQAER